MPSDRNPALLLRVLILPVASFLVYLVPAVLFDYLYYVSDLHNPLLPLTYIIAHFQCVAYVRANTIITGADRGLSRKLTHLFSASGMKSLGLISLITALF
jgi:hypothetical protein